MNVVIISHERSLNKAEGLLRAHKDDHVILVIDHQINFVDKPYAKLANKIILSKNFNVVEITSNIKTCDKVWCISENLLPVQSQLESFYGIENVSAFAAEVLSNKQMFDNYCRTIGLGDYVPASITPTFYNQLDLFKNSQIFSKPDIGTGSNVFFPNDNQNTPSIEYRRWNNKHHFLKYLKDKQIHNEFFDINKQGIYVERFNFKPCKIMLQEYYWSEIPGIAPIGYVANGEVNIEFYLRTSKTKYGDLLDINKNPVESHSVSQTSDIAKDRAVWVVAHNEIDEIIKQRISYFMSTIIKNLKIKELFFAGPDFHVSGDKLIAIDFNPRPGQFINIIDQIQENKIISAIINKEPVSIKKKVLWGCAVLKPGKIKEIKSLSQINIYFNKQNTELKPGVVIPEFQNLQNKAFNINLNITGNSEQELFNNYKRINQLLQDCIIYE